MEIKKSPKADLQNKRGLLLEIGLVVALALVIAAFAYTPKEHRIEKVEPEPTVRSKRRLPRLPVRTRSRRTS